MAVGLELRGTSPSPHGRVETRKNLPCLCCRGDRRPLMVGSKPSMMTSRASSFVIRRPLMVGSKHSRVGHFRSLRRRSPSPHGRVETSVTKLRRVKTCSVRRPLMVGSKQACRILERYIRRVVRRPLMVGSKLPSLLPMRR